MRSLIYFLAFVVVFYPLWVWYAGVNLTTDSVVLFDLFPAFGLLAFSVMWLHIVGGALRQQIESSLDFEKFVFWSSLIVLLALIFHPLLLVIALFVNGGSVFDYTQGGQEHLIWIAVVAWIIFIVYDILKRVNNKGFLLKHWQLVRLVSTLAFFLTLFHSLGIGRDLQTGPLRTVWIFYGVTAGVATAYTYLYKPLVKVL